MKTALARYLAVFPEEKERLQLLQDFLRDTSDRSQVFHRKNFAGHITASGFVLSPNGKKLALVWHKFLNRYLQPGGHVEETDQTVLAAALREIREETDIESCQYLPFHSDPELPIDIDTHEIPANPKKNEPTHFHHDFRFLFRAEREVEPAERSRNDEGQWIWRSVEDAIEEDTFKLVLSKLNKVFCKDEKPRSEFKQDYF
jgi:8-oxo-dGTP pyrophosphatase MutT (NUDIX family)